MIRIKPIKRQFPGNRVRDSLLLYNAEQGSVFIKDTGRAGERDGLNCLIYLQPDFVV